MVDRPAAGPLTAESAAGPLAPGPLAAAWAAAATVPDPELPAVTIADLGILRDVALRPDGTAEVTITPTYSGCPAMLVITLDIERAMAAAGFPNAVVLTVLAPAWTTDWLTPAAHRKLAEAGIAPPRRGPPTCPQCGSTVTGTISEFGATACKALHRCLSCREPFEAFKCH
jgi:ring-1,2-phenylacetyl-CoA epoxidase subunit PaaD